MDLKKLILAAAATTALFSTSVKAEDMMDDAMYFGIEGGAQRYNNVKVEDTKTGLNTKFKAETTGLLGIKAGYTVMENVRADLSVSYNFEPEVNTKGTINGTDYKIDSKFKVWNVMVNAAGSLFDVGSAKVFVSGGIGLAKIDSKASFEFKNALINRTGSVKTKSTNNFAWKIGGGVTVPFSDQAALDVAYHYFDNGKVGKIKDTTITAPTVKHHIRGHQITGTVRFKI